MPRTRRQIAAQPALSLAPAGALSLAPVASRALGQAATPAQQLFTPFAPRQPQKTSSLSLSLTRSLSLSLGCCDVDAMEKIVCGFSCRSLFAAASLEQL